MRIGLVRHSSIARLVQSAAPVSCTNTVPPMACVPVNWDRSNVAYSREVCAVPAASTCVPSGMSVNGVVSYAVSGCAESV